MLLGLRSEARAEVEQALDTLERVDYRSGIAQARLCRAFIRAAEDDSRAAAEDAASAVSSFEDIGALGVEPASHTATIPEKGRAAQLTTVVPMSDIIDDKKHIRGTLDLSNAVWQRAPGADEIEGPHLEIAFVQDG
ncbi:MAG: hypothetical protein ACRDQX_11215, partial [Pseudonocardiaceae bacterium]